MTCAHRDLDDPSSLKGIGDQPQDVCARSCRSFGETGERGYEAASFPLDELLVSLGERTEAVPPRENNNSPRCLGLGRRHYRRPLSFRPRPRASGPAPFPVDLSSRDSRREPGSALPTPSQRRDVGPCCGVRNRGRAILFLILPFSTCLILVTIPTHPHASPFLHQTPCPPRRARLRVSFCESHGARRPPPVSCWGARLAGECEGCPRMASWEL